LSRRGQVLGNDSEYAPTVPMEDENAVLPNMNEKTAGRPRQKGGAAQKQRQFLNQTRARAPEKIPTSPLNGDSHDERKTASARSHR